MKLVGGDSGHVEHEQFVDEVVIAPSERVVVDVLFDHAGELTLEHHTTERVHPLATIRVREERAEPSLDEQFEILRTDADMVAERERIAPYFEAQPDKTVASSPSWTWRRRKETGRSSTPARCTPRWSAKIPATARTAG
jgi:FtsP/CotA-like multicopper oxidase with cupredoxin domain